MSDLVKDFFKATETIIVLGGLFLTVTFGKFFAVATGIAYVLINLPNLWQKIKDWISPK